MEFSMELGLEEENLEYSEMCSEVEEKISESTVIPRVGIYLGLDISEASSGVCLYKNGKKYLANISLETKDSEDFYEVKLRRELKGYLLEFIEGEPLDLVIIEDAYQGINPSTTRKLYALNTAIDELILDGEVKCKKFLRVSNGTWKSWLFSIDTEGKYAGLKDKARIEKCLNLLGIHEDGKGFQDRLDSTGMLIGYFLEGCKAEPKKKFKSFGMGDICFAHKADIDFIAEEVRCERCTDEVSIEIVPVGLRKLSKDLILSYIQHNPKPVYVLDKNVTLGAFGTRLGIESEVDSGYLGFWLKRSKYKKFED